MKNLYTGSNLIAQKFEMSVRQKTTITCGLITLLHECLTRFAIFYITVTGYEKYTT
jgi:hypothetical protein